MHRKEENKWDSKLEYRYLKNYIKADMPNWADAVSEER